MPRQAQPPDEAIGSGGYLAGGSDLNTTRYTYFRCDSTEPAESHGRINGERGSLRVASLFVPPMLEVCPTVYGPPIQDSPARSFCASPESSTLVAAMDLGNHHHTSRTVKTKANTTNESHRSQLQWISPRAHTHTQDPSAHRPKVSAPGSSAGEDPQVSALEMPAATDTHRHTHPHGDALARAEAYMHARTHTHKHMGTHAHTHMHSRMGTHTLTHAYPLAHTHTRRHTCTPAGTHAHPQSSSHTHTCTRVPTRTCAHTLACTRALNSMPQTHPCKHACAWGARASK